MAKMSFSSDLLDESKMDYAYLGESGLKVSKLIFGCMGFGSKSWQPWCIEDEEEAFKLMKYAYDSGMRTFDTADVYSDGHSEVLLGKFLKKYNIPRSTVVICTKLFQPNSADGVGKRDYEWKQNRMGLSRKHIRDSVEGSIERLGTYIDLYIIHRYDPRTPDLEIMRALNECIADGKVRYLGASSMKTYQFIKLQHIAEVHGLNKFVSMQNFYNLHYREEEREMIPYCQENGVAVTPWSPINRGYLARPLAAQKKEETQTERQKTDFFKPSFINKQSTDEVTKRVEKVAADKGVSMSQIATAWALHKGTYPVVGLSSEKRIDEAVESLKVKLTEDDVKYLEQPYEAVEPFVTSGGHERYFADN